MTDEQIVEALELESMPSEKNCIYSRHIEACGSYCDKKNCYVENCVECTEHRMGYGGNRAKVILELVKRQQAEIEELKKVGNKIDSLGVVAALMDQKERLVRAKNEWEREIRAEAVSEFAERLEGFAILCEFDNGNGKPYFEEVVKIFDIERIKKEMTEEEK